jgi:hypothetical protein
MSQWQHRAPESLRNEIDTEDAKSCTHGLEWTSCHDPRCAEIWRIVRSDPDRAAGFGAAEPSQCQPTRVSPAELARARQEHEPDTTEPQNRRLVELFRDDTTIQAARQWGALTDREAGLVQAWVTVGDGQVPWAGIAGSLGCSVQTLRRDFKQVVVRFFDERRTPARSVGENVLVLVRGTRRRRYYVRRGITRGTWSSSGLELVRPRGEGRAIRRSGQLATKRKWRPIRVSPMRRLQAALVFALCADWAQADTETQRVSESPDWVRTLAWARRRVSRRLGPQGPWAVPAVMRVLVRRRICAACHTPILAGGWLAGKQITRRREYCDEACKMRQVRRREARLQRDHNDEADPDHRQAAN